MLIPCMQLFKVTHVVWIVYANIVDVFQLINTFCVLVTKNETKDKGNTMALFSKQKLLGGMKIVYVESRAVGITGLESRVAI